MPSRLAILKIGSFFYWLIFPTWVWAQPRFAVHPSSEQIALDDVLELQLHASSEESMPEGSFVFQAPEFKDLGKQNQSSQRQEIVLGSKPKLTFTKGEIYHLKPLKVGKLQINNIAFKSGDKQFQVAGSVTIEVLEKGSLPKKRKSQHSGRSLLSPFFDEDLESLFRFGEMPNSDSQEEQADQNEPKKTNPSRAMSEEIFIRSELDPHQEGSKAFSLENVDSSNMPRTFYKGQWFTVSYVLYRSLQIFNLNLDHFPIFPSFFRKDLEMPILSQRIVSNPVHIKLHGQNFQFQKGLLARYAVYALQEGELEVDEFSIKFNYYSNDRSQDSDPFRNFFSQVSPLLGSASSPKEKVKIIPLPEQGKPASFTGGVGEFKVDLTLDVKEAQVGDLLHYILSFEGPGNAQLIRAPHFHFPEELEIYDSSEKTQSNPPQKSSKVFEVVLVVKKPGHVSIPELEVSTFDPIMSQYVTFTKPGFDLILKPSDLATVQNQSPESSAPEKASELTQAGQSSSNQRPSSDQPEPDRFLPEEPFVWKLPLGMKILFEWGLFWPWLSLALISSLLGLILPFPKHFLRRNKTTTSHLGAESSLETLEWKNFQKALQTTQSFFQSSQQHPMSEQAFRCYQHLEEALENCLKLRGVSIKAMNHEEIARHFQNPAPLFKFLSILELRYLPELDRLAHFQSSHQIFAILDQLQQWLAHLKACSE